MKKKKSSIKPIKNIMTILVIILFLSLTSIISFAVIEKNNYEKFKNVSEIFIKNKSKLEYRKTQWMGGSPFSFFSAPPELVNVKDLNTGKELNLATYKGKYVLLLFWRYYCDPCKLSLQELVKLYEDYDDVIVVSVHIPRYPEETETLVKEYFEDNNYPFIVGTNNDRSMIERYLIELVPMHYLIDKEGRIVSSFEGSFDYVSLKNRLDVLKREE